MYTVNIGSNDYEGNYLLSPAASRTTPPDKWAAQLVTAYSDALKVRSICTHVNKIFMQTHFKASLNLQRFFISVLACVLIYAY